MTSPRDSGPILITGCSSGLGFASAAILQRAGYVTVATARNVDTLAPLAALGCDTLTLDVTDEASCRAAISDVERRHGPVEVLINNAGIGQYGPLEEVSMERIMCCFEVNLFGMVRMAKLVLPGMRSAGRGRIVNISSVAGRATLQGGGVYHMTKYGIESFADALRPEVKPFGIDVVNILPGPFVSGFRDKVIASIPDTGPDSPYSAFKRNIGRYMLDFLRPGRLGVWTSEQVAQVVFKAATVARPRTRYSVGFYARLGPIGRMLSPDRVVDAATSRQIPHR